MSRTTVVNPNIPLATKRLFSVFIDQGGNQVHFAKETGLTQSYVSRLLKGDYELSYTVATAVCQRWGYSAEWLLLGKGNKKAKPDSTKLVTEIQMLRTEISVLSATVQRLEARMKGYEAKDNQKAV